jgi:hypothetical protein
MFGISFTTKDLIRAGWTFLFGVLGFLIAVQAEIIGGELDARAIAVGAIAAGFSALKNLVLADGTTVKG